jgi:hypothetical protein
MNQSTVWAACATCWVTVIIPGEGANVECDSVRFRVDLVKNWWADARSARAD